MEKIKLGVSEQRKAPSPWGRHVSLTMSRFRFESKTPEVCLVNRFFRRKRLFGYSLGFVV